MKLGIVGLPNVGKSTLFNAITKVGAAAANFPFCTIQPNLGAVAVPDERLSRLSEMYHPKKTTPASVEFVDIAGLVKGASHGEGLGNQFLSHIRETSAVVHVLRCFEDKDISHVSGKVDPRTDAEIVNTELILADLESIDRQLDKLARKARGEEKGARQQLETARRLKEHLGKGLPARSCPVAEEFLRDFFLLTAKPVLYALNVGEKDLPGMRNELTDAAACLAKEEGARALPICAKIEAELAEMSGDGAEQQAFLRELGLTEPALHRLIREGYELLGLQSFYTAGPEEVRAWTIPRGTKAPQAAGVIHTDFERGFIKAEVMSYGDLLRLGAEKALREAGLLRMEGKDYAMRDGDIALFRFNL